MLPDSVYRQQKGRRGDVVNSQGSSLKRLLLWGDCSRHFSFSVFEKVGFDADAIYHIVITFPLLQRLQLPGKSFLNLNICCFPHPVQGTELFCWFSPGSIDIITFHLERDTEVILRKWGILLCALLDAGSTSRKGFQLSPQRLRSAYTFQSTVTMTPQFTRCH